MSDLRPGYQQTEYGTFPCDWQSVTVASTASRIPNAIVGGPFGSDLVFSDYTEAGVPVIRGQNMGGKFVSGEFAFVSSTKAKSLSANCAGWNDLMFTQRGTLGQVSIVPGGVFDRYVVSQSQMKLSVDRSRFNPEYLYYYFTSPAGQRQITDSAIQTGVPHTNLGILRKYRLPVPITMLEQQAIAEALGDADALIEGLEALIAKKRDIRQGAMQELLTGERRLPGFQEEWIIQAIGSVVSMKSGKSITAALISDMHRYPCYGGNGLRGHAASYTHDGDYILIGRQGALCGNVIRASSKFFASEHAIVVTCSNICDPDFIAPILVRMKLNRLSESSAQPGLSVQKLLPLEIYLPRDAEEQRAIAAVLSDMETEIVALKDKLAKAHAVKQGMMQVLLTGEIRLI